MKLDEVLNNQKKDIKPSIYELSLLKKESAEIISLIKKEITKKKIKAKVFIGGSFAKGTLDKRDEYDVDIFIKFDKKHKEISYLTEQILNSFKNDLGFNFKKIHGSRDYFSFSKENRQYEIIPVLDIRKASQASHVTDLSYFHVNYVKKKSNKNIISDILLAKRFCKAQNVYGAESYINGFSGYALECLIIHYKSFKNMLKNLTSAKELIIDPQKHYKSKLDVNLNMSESKLKSPIILVDPTLKDRNVLAALNDGSFLRFQKAARAFLVKPSNSFFQRKNSLKYKLEEGKIKKDEILIELQTDRQEGDIAATKMKKFAEYLRKELSQYFVIKCFDYEYQNNHSSLIFFSLKNKLKIERKGPPLKMIKEVKNFKNKNKNTYIKKDRIYAIVNSPSNPKIFLHNFLKTYSARLKEMAITKFVLHN